MKAWLIEINPSRIAWYKYHFTSTRLELLNSDEKKYNKIINYHVIDSQICYVKRNFSVWVNRQDDIRRRVFVIAQGKFPPLFISRMKKRFDLGKNSDVSFQFIDNKKFMHFTKMYMEKDCLNLWMGSSCTKVQYYSESFPVVLEIRRNVGNLKNNLIFYDIPLNTSEIRVLANFSALNRYDADFLKRFLAVFPLTKVTFADLDFKRVYLKKMVKIDM